MTKAELQDEAARLEDILDNADDISIPWIETLLCAVYRDIQQFNYEAAP